MYSLSVVTPVGPPVTLCGRTHSVRGRTLGTYGEIVSTMVGLRGNPFDLIRRIPDVHGEKWRWQVTEELYRQAAVSWRRVELPEIWAYLKTPSGQILNLWLAVRHAGGELARLDYVEELACRHCDELRARGGPQAAEEFWREVEWATDIASGEDELTRFMFRSLWQRNEGDDSEFNWLISVKNLVESDLGLSMNDVLDMTLSQLCVINRGAAQLQELPAHPDDCDSNADRKFRQQIGKQKKRSVENLTQGLRWDS